MVSYKVLVVGGDHHNTLAVIRSLGRAEIDFKILVHGNYTSICDIHISASKYVKPGMLATCPEDAKILEKTIYEYGYLPDVHWILIPCSDFSEYVIDKSTILSSQSFVLPGFKNNRGQVAMMMDKYEQKLWADRHGIPMAKTWSVAYTTQSFVVPKDMVYPCIVKPEISALGKKSDIIICRDDNALRKALDELAKKGYHRLLIQQFLTKLYEESALGCLVDQPPYICGGIVKKIREYPIMGGTTSYGKFEDDKYFSHSLAYRILEKLWEDGYRGMYDLDVFICQDKVYLNEINFRTSGNGYGVEGAKINLPLIWYMDVEKQILPVNLYTRIQSKIFFMDESRDIRHIIEGNLSFFRWLLCVMKSKAFAKWSLDDIQGSLGFYKSYVEKAVKKILPF